jgi:transcriptional regulator with XRE-family HTH domain
MAQPDTLLEHARRMAGLSRAELARRATTSRPTLAAYAAGTKNPTLATAERIARAAGFDLALAPHPTFREIPVANGRAAYVPPSFPGCPWIRPLAVSASRCT